MSVRRILLEPIVRAALLEDLGRAGDITTDAIVPDDQQAEAVIVSRQTGVLGGIEAALMAWELLDPTLKFDVLTPDGTRLERGSKVAVVRGRARAILAGERVALNLLCRVSGTASATRVLADAIAGHKAKIVCTRKTTPGLRLLEKYAVRLGGGANHRFGLDDAMLIKDNHVAMAGSVTKALERAKAAAGHLVKIELEVDTLDQLAEGDGLRRRRRPPRQYGSRHAAPRRRHGGRPRGHRQPPAASPSRPPRRSPPPGSTSFPPAGSPTPPRSSISASISTDREARHGWHRRDACRPLRFPVSAGRRAPHLFA